MAYVGDPFSILAILFSVWLLVGAILAIAIQRSGFRLRGAAGGAGAGGAGGAAVQPLTQVASVSSADSHSVQNAIPSYSALQSKQQDSCQRPFNIVLNYLMLYSMIAYIIVFCILCDNFYYFDPAVGGGILGGFGALYLLYLITTICSDTRRFLSNLQETDSGFKFVDRLRRTPPELSYSVRCYHYETRTRTVYHTDSNGHRHARLETYTVRVDTFADTEAFNFQSWEDVSGDCSGLDSFLLVKLYLGKSWGGDEASMRSYQMQRDNFYARNRFRDIHMDTSEHFGIAGFKEQIMCLRDPAARPFFLSSCWYWIFTLFGVSIFYRWWLDTLCVKVSYNLRKKVTAAPVVLMAPVVMVPQVPTVVAPMVPVVGQPVVGNPYPAQPQFGQQPPPQVQNPQYGQYPQAPPSSQYGQPSSMPYAPPYPQQGGAPPPSGYQYGNIQAPPSQYPPVQQSSIPRPVSPYPQMGIGQK